MRETNCRVVWRFVIYVCAILFISFILLKLTGVDTYHNHLISYINPCKKTNGEVERNLKLDLTTDVVSQMGVVSTLFGLDISRFRMLSLFNNLLASLDLKGAIIEPSILYKMLQSHYKDLLTKHKYDVSSFKGSMDIITYGMLEEDVQKLQQASIVHKFRQSSFQPYFVQVPVADWMLASGTREANETFTSHIFFKYLEFTIHVVVFHRRQTYLWHAGLESEVDFLTETDLLYVDHPSAFEKFTFDTPSFKMPTLANFYIPSNPHHFLFQISSSRFLECNATGPNTTDLHEDHGKLSIEDFNSRTITALRSLKTFLQPLLMNFWIFSGTMLGWYRDCDVIPFTGDVDFAAWAHELEDIGPIIMYGLNNKKLKLIMRMGVPDEALEFRFDSDSLKVDLFFLYQIINGSWASGHRPSKGYYFRYYYPNFTLCSAELLGEKVQVPCDTEDVISTEYGPNWRTPVSSWYYETSIYNRGPNIYWKEDKRNKTYQEY